MGEEQETNLERTKGIEGNKMVHGPPARRKSQSQSQQANNGSANCEMEMDPLPTPPDGGWGWVVVFGSFMIHIVSKYISVSSCTVGQLGDIEKEITQLLTYLIGRSKLYT